jgi:enoyl-CoA hydratase/carnithine racemase
MLKPTSFLYEVSEGVAWVTLNRPERLNALTFEVYRELTDAFAALQGEREVRAVVITGAGRAFCSGGDVRDIIGELQGRDAEGLLEFTRMTCELVRNIRALRKPVIASLNGTTAGAGACIALASDLRIASAEARIAFLFVKVGLSGADMGAAHLLPRLVGLSKATELLFTGDFITAEEALAAGLYNRVVPASELESETRALAERLARGPSFALGMTKEMLNRELDMSLETALEWEAQAQAACMQHPDYLEAYRAFTEKREPRFRPARREEESRREEE